MKRKRFEVFIGFCLSLLVQILFIGFLEYGKAMEKWGRKIPSRNDLVDFFERRGI